jgi:hypothetical protein
MGCSPIDVSPVNGVDSGIDNIEPSATFDLTVIEGPIIHRVVPALPVFCDTTPCPQKKRGGFNHMSFVFPANRIRKAEMAGCTLVPTNEAAAMIAQVMNDYKIGTVQRAAQIIKQHQFLYADNHKAGIKWLLGLYESGIFDKIDDELTDIISCICTLPAP